MQRYDLNVLSKKYLNPKRAQKKVIAKMLLSIFVLKYYVWYVLHMSPGMVHHQYDSRLDRTRANSLPESQLKRLRQTTLHVSSSLPLFPKVTLASDTFLSNSRPCPVFVTRGEIVWNTHPYIFRSYSFS